MQSIFLTLHLFWAVCDQSSFWRWPSKSSTLSKSGKYSAMTPICTPKWPALLWSALSHGCSIIFLQQARSRENETSEQDLVTHSWNKWRVREMLCMLLSETSVIDRNQSVAKSSPYGGRTLTVRTGPQESRSSSFLSCWLRWPVSVLDQLS